MLNFDLQNHKPLREIVYEELKRRILIGEIAPGTRMMEVELADDMGVRPYAGTRRSYPRSWKKRGLLPLKTRDVETMHPMYLSIKDMTDVLEVRSYLEGMATGMAALHCRKKRSGNC